MMTPLAQSRDRPPRNALCAHLTLSLSQTQMFYSPPSNRTWPALSAWSTACSGRTTLSCWGNAVCLRQLQIVGSMHLIDWDPTWGPPDAYLHSDLSCTHQTPSGDFASAVDTSHPTQVAAVASPIPDRDPYVVVAFVLWCSGCTPKSACSPGPLVAALSITLPLMTIIPRLLDSYNGNDSRADGLPGSATPRMHVHHDPVVTMCIPSSPHCV